MSRIELPEGKGRPDLTRPTGRTRTAQRVVDHIVEGINAGRFKPGDKLPGENTLAADFGVSRPVIREGLRIMEALGLVEVRPGKGCYVLRGSGGLNRSSIWVNWLVAFRHEMLVLLEMREALEVKVAALAAQRISDDELLEIERIQGNMRAILGEADIDIDRAVALDLEFHQALARASRNPLFLQFSTSIMDSIEAYRRIAMSIPNRVKVSIDNHDTILSALKAHDAEAAAGAMLVHIRRVAQDVNALKPPLEQSEGGSSAV